jgi:phage regulator Rha-like protein
MENEDHIPFQSLGGKARKDALTSARRKEIARKAAATRWGIPENADTKAPKDYQEVTTDLIPIRCQAGELLVDSRNVAKVFQIQHRTLFRTILENREALETLGQLRLQRAVGYREQGGGNPSQYAWMSFDQVAFLLTLTKTTELTKEFRLRLILAFKQAREKLRPVDTLLLALPTAWKKTFQDQFYIALLNIYGAEFDKERNKPSWVGSWTNRFIYNPIYQGLSNELKKKRAQYTSDSGRDPDWIRLHQFLEENAKEQLKEMIAKVTAVLQISRSKQDFAEHYAAMMGGAMQLRIEDLLKEEFSGT